MPELDPERIVLRFVNEINRHDVEALQSLMAPDFRFVDSVGQEVHGRERMREAWTAYFERFPDYRILIREHLTVGSVVALFGTASGTYAVNGQLPHQNHWTVPAAWRALIRNEHVAEWQVYVDNEPVRKVIGEQR
ncbi:MAG TPA: nuclear transport factor 2 family protein [Thermoplasmata archaeon]|nr:nuclear transport factor 2 family protein [Thermoplasmata archaeon]